MLSHSEHDQTLCPGCGEDRPVHECREKLKTWGEHRTDAPLLPTHCYTFFPLNEPTFTKRRNRVSFLPKFFLGSKVFLEQSKWTQWSLGVLCKTSQLCNFIILIIRNLLCKKLFLLWSALLGSKIGSDFGGRQISPASFTNWANSWPLLSPLPHLWNLLIVQESSPIQKLFKLPLLNANSFEITTSLLLFSYQDNFSLQ